MNNEILSQDIIYQAKRASLGAQALAGLIDAALLIGLYTVLLLFFPSFFATKYISPVPTIVQIYIAFLVYRLMSLFILAGTIGMLTCRIRLLNVEYKPLSFLEKLAAGFFILINSVNYYTK